MSRLRDLRLARRAKHAGASHALRIVWEARRAHLPISLALALVQHESNFKNIFGCDQGSVLCHADVTHERVQRLLQYVRSGGNSNGVGLTQLTYPPFIYQAEHLGGAHKPKNQLRVGFLHLGALVRHYGEVDGLAAYNAGSPHSRLGQRYASIVRAKQAHWHRVLK